MNNVNKKHRKIAKVTEQLYNTVQKLTKVAGMTAGEIAALVGCSEKTVSRIRPTKDFAEFCKKNEILRQKWHEQKRANEEALETLLDLKTDEADDESNTQPDNIIKVGGIEPNEYQVLSRRTQNKYLSPEEKRCHALYGMSAEVGEIHSLFQHMYQGKLVEKDCVLDECGDLCWFLCELLDTYNIEFADVLRYNIDKLKMRYPEGFDKERSEKRHEL